MIGMKRIRIIFSLCLIVITLSGFGCADFSEGKARGERGVAEFHDRFNAEQFDAIYDGASEMYKQVAARDETIALLRTVRSKLGAAGRSDLKQWRVNTTADGILLSMTYSTRYEQDTAIESFIFQIKGEDVRLAGFNIDSNKLNLD